MVIAAVLFSLETKPTTPALFRQCASPCGGCDRYCFGNFSRRENDSEYASLNPTPTVASSLRSSLAKPWRDIDGGSSLALNGNGASVCVGSDFGLTADAKI